MANEYHASHAGGRFNRPYSKYVRLDIRNESISSRIDCYAKGLIERDIQSIQAFGGSRSDKLSQTEIELRMLTAFLERQGHLNFRDFQDNLLGHKPIFDRDIHEIAAFYDARDSFIAGLGAVATRVEPYRG